MRVVALGMIALLVAAPIGAQQPPGRQDRPDPRQARAREANDIALLLGLADRQRPALNAFLTADRPPPPPPESARPPSQSILPEGDQSNAQPAPQPAAMAAQDDRAKAAFVAQLDPRQRKLLDALERVRHRPFGGAPPHWGGQDRPSMPPR